MVVRLRLAGIGLLFTLCLAAPSAAIDASNVLVLYNQSSPDGLAIATHYQQVHPQAQLLGLSGLSGSEWISADDYLNIVRPQVLSGITSSTQAIVTTKGMPLRISVTQPPPSAVFPSLPTYVDPSGQTRSILWWSSNSSLESELTNINRVSTWQMMGDQSYSIPGHFSNNPYFQASGSFSRSSYDMFLTSRLDGYNASQVNLAVDRAQNAVIGPMNTPQGPIRFVVDNDPSKDYAPTMANLVNNVLTPRGVPVTYDNTAAYVGNSSGPVIAYDSHGANQASTPAHYTNGGLNLSLVDGAVFNTWESYNASSFNTGTYTGPQGQVADWIAMGGTAAMGNVAEPGANINRVANEDHLFQMLLDGKTWGEAAWSSLRELGFVNTVVGDPLMTWRILLPADFNMDGRVSVSDLAILGANWGTQVGGNGNGWSQGDANSDGWVTVTDLAILGGHWGEVSSWAASASKSLDASEGDFESMVAKYIVATPEPGTLHLATVAVGALACWRWRRRRKFSDSVQDNSVQDISP